MQRSQAVKGTDASTLLLLLVARAQMVSQRQATANIARGLLVRTETPWQPA